MKFTRVLNIALMVTALACFSAALLAGCSLGQAQASSQQLSQQLQTAQAASQAAGAQLAAAQAAAQAAQDQVTQLATQVKAVQQQIATAQTQPDESGQIATLQTQLATLKTQQATLPTADQLAKLQAAVAAIQVQKTATDQALNTAAQAAQLAATNLQNSTNGVQAGGAILTATAPVLSQIPQWGWVAGLGASLLGNVLLNYQKGQATQAATSIAQSVGVAASAGQITVSPGAVATLDAIQTPLAKSIIDAHQAATGADSLGDLVTPAPVVRVTAPATIPAPRTTA